MLHARHYIVRAFMHSVGRVRARIKAQSVPEGFVVRVVSQEKEEVLQMHNQPKYILLPSRGDKTTWPLHVCTCISTTV